MAFGLGEAPAILRSSCNEIVPGSAPLRSSDTGTVAQVKDARALVGQVPKSREAAEEAGQLASTSAGSSAARTENGLGLDIGSDDSGSA
jgi:hypothetical protein